MSKLLGYFKVGVATTAEVAIYAASRRRYLFLEGRVLRNVFRNWALRFPYVPVGGFFRPTSQEEIVGLIRRWERLRVFGSGHSFNDGVVSEEALVSLDAYAGQVDFNEETNQLTVRAGTRVRDVVKLLDAHELAFKALPSHDAQSMGGMLATDVHGTGSRWGFISESVVGLTVIDGNGEVHHCTPSDDLFRAAVGGVGAVGIISEVVVQGVPKFKVEQRTEMKDLAWVRDHYRELVDDHEHLSLYLFPFMKRCQVNTWTPTTERATRRGEVKEFVNISADALLAAWVGNFVAYTRLLPWSERWSRLAYLIKRGSGVVLESDQAYNRTIYHLHQELEFAVPVDMAFKVCDELLALYQRIYQTTRLPYSLIEVRFTPDQHDCTLLGAGRGQQSAWIDLVCNDSDGFETYYRAATQLIRDAGGRPHLGKYCDIFDHDDIERLHGDNYRKFLRLVEEHDPDGKFANPFTRRVLGTHRQADQPAFE